MSQFPLLVGYCFAMFFGAYLSGWVTTAMQTNRYRMRLVTIFGAGLLVGTALVVIIPEGVAMYFDAMRTEGLHAHTPVVLPPGVKLVETASHVHRELTEVAAVSPVASHDHDHTEAPEEAAHGSHEHGATAGIGAALVLGFAFQLLVDRFAGGLHGGHGHGGDSHSSDSTTEGGPHSHAHDHDVELSNGRFSSVGSTAVCDGHAHAPPAASQQSAVPAAAGFSVSDAGGGQPAAGGGGSSLQPGATCPARGSGGVSASAAAHAANAKGNSAFVGLIVHAAVDGIALGAAVAEGDASLGLIVFVAIMLHKAPSSFGLASYLLHQGYSAAQVRNRLAAFSSSAPTGALLTYALLATELFAYTRTTLAMCLLFSGGTFLYVATAHILPEIQAESALFLGATQSAATQGRREGGSSLAAGAATSASSLASRLCSNALIEVSVLLAGLLLPLAINVPHGH